MESRTNTVRGIFIEGRRDQSGGKEVKKGNQGVYVITLLYIINRH